MRELPFNIGKWLAWWLKVNTDGSCKQGRASGGGIVRDREGNFCFGFYCSRVHDDIIRAELEAILEGIIWFECLNIYHSLYGGDGLGNGLFNDLKSSQ